MSQEYKVLREEEKIDCLVSFLKGQEFEFYTNTINLERFNRLYSVLEEGKFKEKIKVSISETENALKEVGAIIECTIPQLPSPKEIERSIKRIKNKEEKNK